MLPVLFALFASPAIAIEGMPDDAMQARIDRLIYQNECAARTACLTSWNRGEEFASLGIGHFIWYPAGTAKEDKAFRESFPKLLDFLHTHHVVLPDWLRTAAGCPWPNRDSFVTAQDSPRMQELRGMLIDTMPLQSAFLFQRLQHALPEMLKAAPGHLRSHIEAQYQRVAASPMGAYVLTDYVNFKGEGVSESERYHGQGWGLLQVLSAMQGKKTGLEAIHEFARVADALLTRRVANSPAERHEVRWLEGWRKRLNTYVIEAGEAKRHGSPEPRS